MTPRMFSALMLRSHMERDWQAILAGQITMAVACLGGAKANFEDFVLTRQREKLPFEGFGA